MDNFTKVLENITILTGEEINAKLELQIQSIIAECLAYCYRSDIPEAMVLPLSDVVANELQKRNAFGIDGDITSYKEGDMSVTFGNSNTTRQAYNGKLEPFKQIIGVVE